MIRKALTSLLEVPGAANRITPMEGMRGYAVLLVFLVHHHTLFGHFLAASSLPFALSRFGHDIGHSGVDLFFVLSGFLIYGHVFQKAPSYFLYLRKRLRRIYPVFLCVFTAYVLASLCIPAVSKLPHSALQAGIYVAQNLLFLPGIFPIEPMITVTWSLSYEFLFYLTIPILIVVTGMRRWRRPDRVWFFLGLLGAICLAGYTGLMPHTRMGLFVAGILLYEATDTAGIKKKLHPRGEILAIGIYLTALTLLALFEFSNTRIAFHPDFPNRTFVYWTIFLSVGLFGLSLYTINFSGLLQRLFNAAPLRWLGNMSYSYFLCHGLVLQGVSFALQRILAPELQSSVFFFLLLILNLALTLAASLVLFWLVENPLSLSPKPPSVNRAESSEAVLTPCADLSEISAKAARRSNL